MIIDLNQIDRDPFVSNTFDFCICGAGVAGITLAIKLSQNFNVLLLEAGGFEYSQESQDIYKGRNIGTTYFAPDITRLRFFGGTSNHWTGWCKPMEDYDFEQKKYVNHSGWPIKKSDLDPYLPEAETILDLDNTSLAGEYVGSRTIEDAVISAGDFRTINYKWSPPTNFGVKYLSKINDSNNIQCYLNANLTDIVLHENYANIKNLEIKNYSGTSFSVNARQYILSAGGIENPRILLNANRQIEEGIGNKQGLVGRFFTEHNNKYVGEFILEDTIKQNIKENWRENWKLNNNYFSPTLSFVKQEQLLNFGIFVQLKEKLSFGQSFKEKMEKILCEDEWSSRLVEKVSGSACETDGFIRVVAEQELNALSRISLASEKDKFGNKRINIDWKQSELDKRTMRVAVLRLAQIFAENNIGRIKLDDWIQNDSLIYPINDEVAGHHHMCTTRMANTENDGVVDKNLKVFGIGNLHITGSSVFSTPGQDSPTITIVQLTLRLADYLLNRFA